MANPHEVDLVAVLLPPSDAVPVVLAAWERNDAVVVLDPAAPPAWVDARLAAVRPTALVDGSGSRTLPDGVPVARGVAAVGLTSGTTAEPKAVELTFAGLAASAAGVGAVLGDDARGPWLACLPLHYVAGLAVVGRAWTSGAELIVHDGFDLPALAHAIEVGGGRAVSLVPTQLRRLLDAGVAVDRLDVILLGGGPVPADLAALPNVHTTYGMTETWGGVVHDHYPLPGVELRVDADGTVLVRTPTIMRGYRFDADATTRAFGPDSWFRTGDTGALDGDGRLTVLGRRDEMIISGGVNISPFEVEDALRSHPDVLDVIVTGAPDADLGAHVVAYVVPRDPVSPPTLDALRDHGAATLNRMKLPRELVLRDSIPRTPSGKPQRRLLG
ncbi:MAG: acyl-CoA synthetase (AMP-forming)/AMP-acid ligase [Actinomycetia bacterium]|nr:acyl-CoA synthetase (AMP-forming)/AMP-acid ligase [Actinomycetes bacterium]